MDNNISEILPIKKSLWQRVLFSIAICGGSFIMAIGAMGFLSPYDIVPGGFTGFAIIINKTLIPAISPGIMALFFNIPLFIFAIKVKGRKFAMMSVVGTISYSLFIDFINLLDTKAIIDMSVITDNALLATIYGGVCLGIGYGIIVRAGGSTGGSDTLANLINTVKPAFSFGTILLFVDGFVVILSCIAFGAKNGGIEYGIQPALYAFLAIFLGSKIADYVIEGKHSSRAYYIICSNAELMTEAIYKNLRRGVTALRAKGMYSKTDKEILLCVVLRNQSNMLKRVVFEADPSAFVFSNNVSEVFGEGFNKPELKKHKEDKLKSAD